MSNNSYHSVISNIVEKGRTGQQDPRQGHEKIMIKNAAGGMTYEVSDEELIDRILILGTNANTYYSSATKLTTDSINSIQRMISEGKGNMIYEHLKSVYETGRAPKQDPTFFVMALLTQSNVPIDVKKNALLLVSSLRTFSQLYMWEGMRKQLAGGKKGFGRSVRNAILQLFKNKTGMQLVYQGTKYQSRKYGDESWSIADIISCAHIPSKTLTPDAQIAIAYMINGISGASKIMDKFKSTEHELACDEIMKYLHAVELVKSEYGGSIDDVVQLIRQHHLPREVLNTSLLNNITVWKSLLFKTHMNSNGNMSYQILMPITALIRNLGVMSAKGLFNESEITNAVIKHLTNKNVLKKGRVHPVALLVAKLTYQTGRGIKGKLNWQVNAQISSALEDAFYISFQCIDGTGKRILHAVDCSGSMTCATCAVPHITACQAVGTLMLEAVKREHNYHTKKIEAGEKSEYVQDVMLFNNKGSFVNVTHQMRLNEVMQTIQDRNFGATDCAQPMIRALAEYNKSKQNKGKYDLFIIYTDNQTYYGNVHPSEALDKYRKATNIDAKMIVIATTPTSNSIGYGGSCFNSCSNSILDEKNKKNNTPLALNIVGFDLNAPALIKNFSTGSNECDTNENENDYDLVDDI